MLCICLSTYNIYKKSHIWMAIWKNKNRWIKLDSDITKTLHYWSITVQLCKFHNTDPSIHAQFKMKWEHVIDDKIIRGVTVPFTKPTSFQLPLWTSSHPYMTATWTPKTSTFIQRTEFYIQHKYICSSQNKRLVNSWLLGCHFSIHNIDGSA